MKYFLCLLLITSQAIANETRIEFKKFFGENEITVTKNNGYLKLLPSRGEKRTNARFKESFYLLGPGITGLEIKLNIKNIEKVLVLRKPESYDKKIYKPSGGVWNYYTNCYMPTRIASFILNPNKKITSISFRMEMACNGMSHIIVWAKTKNGKYYLTTTNLLMNIAHQR